MAECTFSPVTYTFLAIGDRGSVWEFMDPGLLIIQGDVGRNQSPFFFSILAELYREKTLLSHDKEWEEASLN